MKKRLKLAALVLATVATAVGGLFLYLTRAGFPSPPNLDGEFSRDFLAVGGRDRTFQSYVPAGVPEGAPLVFVLHGSKLDSNAMRRLTGYRFDELADRDGFVVVYPDGFENHWNDCRASASYAANRRNIDDIAFFRAMVDSFVERHGVSRDAVFVVGHSNGGHMAFKLAQVAPDLVRAIFAVSANLPVDENSDCKPLGRPVSVAVMNGTEDPINPYNGGLVELFGDKSRGTVRSTDETMSYWLRLASIDDAPRTTRLPEADGDATTNVELRQWSRDGVQVWLFTLEGSGHVIASKLVRSALGTFMGGHAGDLETADEAWRFFRTSRESIQRDSKR